MLELLGNDLTARGAKAADILTVKSPISPPRCRLFTSAMAPSTPAGGRVPAYGAGSRRAAGPAAGRVTARYPRGERCFGRLPDRGSRGDREKM